MNNIDRAARAIQPYEPRNGSSRDVAIDLASADLLAPDLPPVTRPRPGCGAECRLRLVGRGPRHRPGGRGRSWAGD